MPRRLLVLLLMLAALTACGRSPDPDDPDPTPPSSTPPSSSSTAPAATTASPVSSTPATATSAPGTPAPAAARWVPAPGTPWQWQLTTPVDTGVDVPVYDIDGHENPASVVAALHARGRHVICYVNAGAAETFRPDYGAFPPNLLGRTDGWKGERWLDIRQRDALRPIMAARFEECRGKGFDAVEADLVEAYRNDTGFPINAQDQLAYNRMLADLAHQRGLSIGLKNDLDQVPDLLGSFEFAVNEQCAEHDECRALLPFIQAGKAVFHVEYDLDNAAFCPRTTALRFSSMRKKLDLDAARWPC
jgi:hypothetical protein